MFARRYWWLIMLVALGGHLIAWILANPQPQQVRWVFATTNTPLGVVIAVSVVFGAVMALLIRFQRHAGLEAAPGDGHRSQGHRTWHRPWMGILTPMSMRRADSHKHRGSDEHG